MKACPVKSLRREPHYVHFNADPPSTAVADKHPADASAVGLAGAVTGDAVAYLIEAPQFFDADADHLAGPVAT